MSLQLAQAESLPSIDLSKTLVSLIVSPEFNHQVTEWTRHHFSTLAWLNRIGSVLTVVGMMLPRNLGTILMVVGTPLTIVAVLPPAALLNVPLLKLLLWQYDFWVFSVFSLVNWTICAVLFGNLRVACAIVCWLNTSMIISIDANTRTIGTLVRGATLWFPGVIFVTAACAFHLLDVDEKHYQPLIIPGFDFHKFDISLVNLFANITITISVYVGVRCYFKHEVLRQRFKTHRMIPSSIFRVGLSLEPQKNQKDEVQTDLLRKLYYDAPNITLARLATPTKTSLMVGKISASMWRSVRVFTDTRTPSTRSLASDSSLPPCGSNSIPPLKLIPPRVTSFLAANTLLPCLKVSTPLSRSAWIFLKACWMLGLLFSTYGLTQMPSAHIASIVGLTLSTIYVGTVVAHCNRGMLLGLLRNFDALYVSFQGCACFVSIGVSLQWRDWRIAAIGSQVLWLHLLVVIDALLPDARQRLGLRKRLFAPAMAGGILFSMILLASIFTSFELLMPRLENHVIFCLGADRHCVHTLSFLLMRFVSLLIVSFRLLWGLAVRPEGELLFFRGRVQFLAPPHLLPFEIANDAKASGQVHAIIPPGRTAPT